MIVGWNEWNTWWKQQKDTFVRRNVLTTDRKTWYPFGSHRIRRRPTPLGIYLTVQHLVMRETGKAVRQSRFCTKCACFTTVMMRALHGKVCEAPACSTDVAVLHVQSPIYSTFPSSDFCSSDKVVVVLCRTVVTVTRRWVSGLGACTRRYSSCI